MNAFIQCEEKGRLSYIEQLATGGSRAMGLGTAVHLGYEKQSADVAVKSLSDARGGAWTSFEQDELDTDKCVTRALVEGGLRLWKEWPREQEVEFNIPLLNPATGRPSSRHRFAGKFDGLWAAGEYSGSSRPVLLEIKTTSRIDASYLGRLSLDWQVSAYMAAASQMLGEPVREMVYRIARKPSIKPRSKVKRPDVVGADGKATYSPETIPEYSARLAADYEERPDFYFEEVVVKRTDRQILRWRHEAWALHEKVLMIQAGGMTVRNPSHCFAYGRPCTFFNLCQGIVGPEVFAVKETAHPELKGTN
jgi:hypothetical protein